ncbi:MAG: hypothetical protein ACRCT7_18690 [Shewanella sp.]
MKRCNLFILLMGFPLFCYAENYNEANGVEPRTRTCDLKVKTITAHSDGKVTVNFGSYNEMYFLDKGMLSVTQQAQLLDSPVCIDHSMPSTGMWRVFNISISK